MSYDELNKITDRITRFLSDTVVSGTYSTTELEYYAQDAIPFIEMDYPGFGDYTITVTSGISPNPTHLDSVLISLKAASLAYTAVVQESVADSILVKAGAIMLDTSRSLRSRGIEADRFEKMYRNLIDSVLINGTGGSITGYRLDNYITVKDEVSDSESLV